MAVSTVVSPAKLILMGEHAVVYGRPALITSVDLWLQVRLETRSEPGIRLHLAEKDHRETTTWPDIRTYTDAVRERWERYVEAPGADSFADLRSDDPAHLVKVALGEAARRWDAIASPALDITVRSEQPIGAGFGSSAAVAAATVSALASVHDLDPSTDDLYPVVLDVERRQHGTPSGVDPATVLHGGLLWAETTGDELTPTPLSSPSVPNTLRVFQSGTPNESTGTVVDAVRARHEDNPKAFRSTLDQMEAATRALRDEFTDGPASPSALRRALRQFEEGLEALGVVPPAVQELIQSIENKGGAAKISGAGALTGSGAGCLLVYHPDPNAALWGDLHDLSELNVRLGVEGVHEATVHA
jgi:mevalonate kinase